MEIYQRRWFNSLPKDEGMFSLIKAANNTTAAFLVRQAFLEAKRAAAASARSRIPIFRGLNIIQLAANSRLNSQSSVPRVARETEGDENEDGDEGLDNGVNEGEGEDENERKERVVKEMGVALKIREEAAARAKALKRELAEVEDAVKECDIILGITAAQALANQYAEGVWDEKNSGERKL